MKLKIILILLLVLNFSVNFIYAQNKINISTGKVRDSRDKRIYKTVKIQSENEKTVCWFSENLKFISSDLMNLPYNHKDSLGAIYGYFYEHLNLEKLCPKGWHVPTSKDWLKLIEILGKESSAVNSLRSKEFWQDKNNGSNSSGLNFLPLEYALSGCGWSFDDFGYRAVFLVNNEQSDTRKVISFSYEDTIEMIEISDNNLYTCRCVKD